MKPLHELIDLTGRTAIVTATPKELVKAFTASLKLMCTCLSQTWTDAATEATAQDLTQKGWTTAAIKTDVSNEEMYRPAAKSW